MHSVKQEQTNILNSGVTGKSWVRRQGLPKFHKIMTFEIRATFGTTKIEETFEYLTRF